MSEKKSNPKNAKFKNYLLVVLLIVAAVVIALLFYRQRIETTIFKNITEDWQTYNDSHGFSFKYPKGWTVEAVKGFLGNNTKADCEIYKNDDKEKSTVILSISGSRSIDIQEPGYAIQISIPFDKKNYLIFSTSTNTDSKEIFYNIPVTLETGR